MGTNHISCLQVICRAWVIHVLLCKRWAYPRNKVYDKQAHELLIVEVEGDKVETLEWNSDLIGSKVFIGDTQEIRLLLSFCYCCR